MAGEFIAIALGLLVGFSLGALGGGGSTLAVPILVFVAGLQAQEATTASLLVVGVAAAFGVVSHLRNGNVRLGAGVAFGAAGIVGSRLGLLVNRSLDENVLLLAFSVLIAAVAIRMYRSAEGESAGESESADDDESQVSVEPDRPFEWSISTIATLAAAASAVGLLTGLFGVGGGFAVVPALTLLLKFPAKKAIGTSLVVIVINAIIALALRSGPLRSGEIAFDWALLGPFLATVSIGVIVGTRVASGIDAERLTRAFAAMLALVAIYTAGSTLVAV